MSKPTFPYYDEPRGLVLPAGVVISNTEPYDPKRKAVPGSHLIDVYLFRRSTGERRIYQPEYPWVEDGEGNPAFIWEEGNYGCDCNRSLFLYDWDEDKELPCDNGIDREIFIEKIVIRGTDTVLYAERIPA